MADRDSSVAQAAVFPIGEQLEPGYYVVGEFLGVKLADSFVRGTEKINVRPKLGVRTASGDLSIAADSDGALAAATSGIAKGDRIAAMVRVRAPFGSTGPVKFALAGSEDDGSWK